MCLKRNFWSKRGYTITSRDFSELANWKTICFVDSPFYLEQEYKLCIIAIFYVIWMFIGWTMQQETWYRVYSFAFWCCILILQLKTKVGWKQKTFLLERLTFNKISSKDTSTLQECSMQCSVCTHTSDFIRCYECSIWPVLLETRKNWTNTREL